MVEDLDDLLPAHDLLDEALLGGERVLLGDHVPRGRAAQPAGDLDHDGDHDDDEDRQPQAVVEHHGEHGAQGQPGLDEGRHGLADELADGVGVIGVGRHDRAVGVGVEVLDRQGLHAVEHVVAHVLEGALRDHGHDPRVQQAREHAEGVDGAHHGDDPHEHGHDGAESHAQPGGDDLVDDPLHEDRGDRRGDGGSAAHRLV